MGGLGRTLEQETGCRRSGLGNVTVLAALNRADPCLPPGPSGEDQPPRSLSPSSLSSASLVAVGALDAVVARHMHPTRSAQYSR